MAFHFPAQCFAMDLAVKSILRMSYRYGRLLGVINFEINMHTGRARITRRSTIIAIIVNSLILAMIPVLGRSSLVATLWDTAGLLNEYLILVVMGLRLGCVIITLLSRWCHRRQFVRLVNTFRMLTLRRPQVIAMWRRGVLRKTISVVLNESVQIFSGFFSIYAVLTWRLGISLVILSTLTALVNVIISQYYFALLNIHLQYSLLNRDLRVLLDETRSLQGELRSGARMTKCCSLADRLEFIALTQMRLQMVMKSITQIFGIQGFCVSTSIYISIMGTVYYTYTNYIRGFGQQWSPAYFGLITLQVASYIADVMITLDNIYYVQDHHVEMHRLLEQYTTFARGLDSRLDTVVSLDCPRA